MLVTGTVISLIFIAIAAWLLLKKYNPQAVLLVIGLTMLVVAMILGTSGELIAVSTGNVVFDFFRVVVNTFTGSLSRFGFMIMAIGGYVAYMNHIKASEALVYVSMKPMSLFKKYPYIAAIAVIPIGQILFVTIPSAAGLGLLLAASILPVLVSIGISRLTAVSIISACTVFDMGPSSANTAKAAELAEISTINYFITHQLPLIIPMTILLMVVYFFTSRYFDKKDVAAGKSTFGGLTDIKELKAEVPLIYAILPMLPLVLLIVFSPYLGIFTSPPITLDTTTAMVTSLFVAMLFELVRKKSLKQFFDGVQAFWDGMGKIFATVVTLIVCAEIFSMGLINLGFVDALVQGSTQLGFSGGIIGILIAILVFLAAMLMGSGNAAFFSFGPLVPNIAKQFGMSTSELITPIQLSASIGRTASPIAGVIIAISQIAGVSPFELVKRNLIPMGSIMVFMILYNYFIL
ncbi:MAG: C4-dicarboxylate transporter DcuC [Bacteroidales bacterium]|nr:C4-dicarboxylate transporter DcuC [Bacteroidales bacterium]